MKVVEPTKHIEYYNNWIKKGRPLKMDSTSRKIIIQFLEDMEIGCNINTSKKGKRSYHRLCNLKTRLNVLTRYLKEHYKIEDITKTNSKVIIKLFSDMREGKIKSNRNKAYSDVDSYAEVFKTFWHWYMRVNKKEKKIIIEDITEDIDTKGNDKPKWVYLDEKEFESFTNDMKFNYKVMCWFLFDSGIRAPKEMMNTRVRDIEFSNDKTELEVRDSISKTFGRKIKLMLCSNLLKDYIKKENLKPDDYLFTSNPARVNEYLKRVAKRIYKDAISKAGEYYKNITMYDIRHCSSCYWLPRYKTESAMKYRFGWIKSDKIQYYSEFLGMKDTIQQEDLLVNHSASEIEKELLKERKERQIMEDRIKAMEKQQEKMESMFDKMLKSNLENMKKAERLTIQNDGTMSKDKISEEEYKKY